MELTQLKPQEERKHENGKMEYVEIIRVTHDTSLSGCEGHIANTFWGNIGSFRIEAAGTAIKRAVDIAELARRKSYEKWGGEDFLEVEKIDTSTLKGKKGDIPKISILLSKHSFLEAKKFMDDLRRQNEFHPIKIIRVLQDNCKIDILNYLEILSEDNILRNYFRSLTVLLNYSKNESELIEKLREERDRFTKINGSEIHGFARGIYDLYGLIEVIDSFLSVEEIDDIIPVKQSIDTYFSKIESPEKYTNIIYDKTIEISENINRFKNAEDPYYKLFCLGEAKFILEDIDSIVERHFVEPFKTMYQIVLNKWRGILNESREKTRNSPEIKITPKYESKPVGGILDIEITLENTGFVEIEDVYLEVVEDKKLRVVDKNPKKINILPPNRKSTVHFRINIAEEKAVNVKYILKSEGQERCFEREDSFIILTEDTNKEFKEIPNPYTFGRPLSPGKGDIFVGREEIFRFIEQNFKKSLKAMVFIIHGQRRTGKTSFLHFLSEKINVDKRFIYVDMQLRQEKSLSDFLSAIADIISGETKGRIYFRDYREKPYTEFENFLRKAIEESTEGLVLMFDEFELLDERIKDSSTDIDERFLEFLRGILHKEDRLTLIFAGTFDESKISPKWKTLFNVGFKLNIASLRESEARFLIENPVKEHVIFSDIVVDMMINLSGKNPFYLQGLCRLLIDHLNLKESNYVRREHIEEMKEIAINALEDSYSHFWDNLSHQEKIICKALAAHQLGEFEAVGASDIEESIGRNERLNLDKIGNVLGDLFEKKILEKYGYAIPRYRFGVELLAHQIHKFGRY